MPKIWPLLYPIAGPDAKRRCRRSGRKGTGPAAV